MKKPPIASGSSEVRSFKSLSFRELTTTAERSERMARVRRSATGAELAVQRVLRELRVRFTAENRDLPGSPDMANRSRGFAIFVHGCYWHRHPGCARATTPSRNREFWQAKFDANVRRDRRVARRLRQDGYKVITIWECRTKDPKVLARRLAREMSRNPEAT